MVESPLGSPSCVPVEYRYGAGGSQVADLYLPDAECAPVLCLLHGGFWKLPYGKGQMSRMAADLCRRGFAVWNIEYRRVGELGGGWPGALADVVSAIEFLEVNFRSQSALDLDRVALIGHSAGGQLAIACASMQPGLSRASSPRIRLKPRAVVGLAAIADLQMAFHDRATTQFVREFLGGSPSERPACYSDASPVELLPHGASLLMLHGLNDDDVPIAQSRSFTTAAMQAGDSVLCGELEGVDHMSFLDPGSTAYASLCALLLRALSRKARQH